MRMQILNVKVIRALKTQAVPTDEWIRDMTNNGLNMYHANILDQVVVRGLQYQNAQCFHCGKYGHLQQNYEQGVSKGQ